MEHLMRALDPSGGTPTSTPRPILRVEGVSKAFSGHVVLKNVSAELHAGEVVLLQGDNGSGKTTLLNILTGNLRPDRGRIGLDMDGSREDFLFPQRRWQRCNPFDHFTPDRVAREGIGRTWQEIRLFQTQSLSDNIAVATPRQSGENPIWILFSPVRVRKQERATRNAAEALLEQIGLKGRGASSADRVSLGQSKRVAIARALQGQARLLFLDEPLAGLDRAGIDEILQLLRRIVKELRVTLVIVEHALNVSELLDLATIVWTLRDGELTVDTLDRAGSRLREQGKDSVRPWLHDLAGAAGEITRQTLPSGAALTTVSSATSEPGEVVLAVRDLVVYRARRLVIGERTADGSVRGLSLELRRGQVALLEAPNGWGKTTLLETLAGLLPAARGSIQICGIDAHRLTAWERAGLGMSFLQSRNNVFPSLTVRESLRLAGRSKVPPGLERFAARRVGNLSGGEKQKVALACAMGGRGFQIALLDEPFSALDKHSIADEMARVADARSAAGLLIAVPRGISGPD
jgi:branched-chain amino acid transport system ATP-binding protein